MATEAFKTKLKRKGRLQKQKLNLKLKKMLHQCSDRK